MNTTSKEQMNICDRHGALDILANVVSNVQDYLPNKKNFPEHRVSCHRCGNIRKRKLLCPRQSCPHIFCGRCADKMLEEHGEEVFAGGCPVCQELCCCSNKTVSCSRQNHCYRKCPSTKGKNGMKIEPGPNDTDYHISAPALEILAQVVSDPFHHMTSRPSSPGTETKRRKTAHSSSPIANNTNAMISIASSMVGSRYQTSPRPESGDEKINITLDHGERSENSSLDDVSSGGQPTFHDPQMGRPEAIESSPKSKAPSQPFSSDAASLAATYAMSSLSALSAAAGNYDQYTKNMTTSSPQVTPLKSSPPPRTIPLSPQPALASVPGKPSSSLLNSSRMQPNESEQSKTGLPETQKLQHDLSASYLSHPQYMASAAALSDSSFESYDPVIPKSLPTQEQTSLDSGSSPPH